MERSGRKVMRGMGARPAQVPAKLMRFLRARMGRRVYALLPGGWAPRPTVLGLHLTLGCNLNCRQCISLSLAPRYPRMHLASWMKVLDQAARISPSIYVTGGEPLLFPGVMELLKYGCGLCLQMHLQTNGILLERYAAELVAMGLDRITVSLDGVASVHDAVRGVEGAFARSLEGIRAVLRCRRERGVAVPLVDINSCMLAGNLDTINELADVAGTLGVDHLQFQHVIFNNHEQVRRHNALWSDSFVQANGFDMEQPCLNETEFYENEIDDQLLEERLLPTMEALRKREGPPSLGFFPDLSAVQTRAYYQDLDHPFPQYCQYAHEFMRIMPDGTVEPCFRIRMGNVAETPLTRIWNGTAYRRFRSLLRKGLWPGCVRCCGRSYR